MGVVESRVNAKETKTLELLCQNSEEMVKEISLMRGKISYGHWSREILRENWTNETESKSKTKEESQYQ